MVKPGSFKWQPLLVGVLCLAILCPPPLWAAVALVQSATQQNGTGDPTTAPCVTLNSTVAGNYLTLVGHIGDGGGDTLTITNTTDGTNTYTTRTAVLTDAGVQRVYAVISYAKVASNGNYTVCANLANTSGGSNRYYTLGLIEWSGIAASSPEDTWDANDNIDVGSTTDSSAGPITTTDAGDLLIGVAAIEDNSTNVGFGSPTSWTNIYRQNDGTNYYASDTAYWLPGTIQTTYTAQWSHNNNPTNTGAGLIVALKPDTGGGGGGTVRSRMLMGVGQ